MDYINFSIIIVISIVSGVVIGWHRRCKGAGSRDFSLIILGVALVVFTLKDVISSAGLYDGITNILISLGFIAAGIMFNQQQKVVGITTGLAIYSGAVIGIMYGLEQYVYGAVLSAAVIIILILNKFHKKCE